MNGQFMEFKFYPPTPHAQGMLYIYRMQHSKAKDLSKLSMFYGAIVAPELLLTPLIIQHVWSDVSKLSPYENDLLRVTFCFLNSVLISFN